MDPRKGKTVIKGNREVNTKVTTSDYALEEAFDIFYAAKRSEGMRPRTLEEYITYWGYFRDFLAKAYPNLNVINEVTATVIRDYANYLSTRTKYEDIPERKREGVTLSPFTIAGRVRTLKTIFNFLSRERMVTLNPVASIKLPRYDKEDKETLTDEHIRKLLEAPDIRSYAGLRDRALIYLLVDGGFRIQEALRLTMEHIDIKSRCVHLPAWMNKNRKPRVVPVSAEVIREILTLVNENKRYFDNEHIFLANYGEPLKADHFRHRLRVHKKNAGLEDHIPVNPHGFRSYFLTQFMLNGGDIFSAQRIVAHANIVTTRGYVRMSDDNIRMQHDKYSPIARLGLSRVNKRRD